MIKILKAAGPVKYRHNSSLYVLDACVRHKESRKALGVCIMARSYGSELIGL